MAQNPTQQQWAASLLERLGIHQTPGAIQAITGWERAEGGHWNNQARYNPLNTTQSAPGAGNTGSQGNIKVYKSWDQGLDATVKTLRNGRYGGILSALQAGDPSAVASAIGQTPWGTSGGLVRSTIMGTPRVSGVQAFDPGGSQPQASSSAPSAPGAPSLLDAGQGSDFTSLLGSLLSKPQPAQASPSPIAAPTFAAVPKLPQGAQLLQPSAVPAPQQQDKLGDVLSLVGALGGSGPSIGSDQAAGAPQTGPVQPTGPATPTAGGDIASDLVSEANKINSAHVPYLWGGGHASPAKRGSKVTPLDCSGAVSRVLGINPRVASQFETWGDAGKGKSVTIYANDQHVLMEINGHFFGTSRTNPGGGAGWIPRSAISSDYLKRFTARHPPGQ